MVLWVTPPPLFKVAHPQYTELNPYTLSCCFSCDVPFFIRYTKIIGTVAKHNNVKLKIYIKLRLPPYEFCRNLWIAVPPVVLYPPPYFYVHLFRHVGELRAGAI